MTESVATAELALVEAIASGLQGVVDALRRVLAAKATASPEVSLVGGAGIDLRHFDPKWKRGIRLSPLGRQAIRGALDAGMTQVEVAELFQINKNAVATYVKK